MRKKITKTTLEIKRKGYLKALKIMFDKYL